MKRNLFMLGIVFLFVIVLVKAQHGVHICDKDYDCTLTSDAVCPLDFGADCDQPPDCDIDCYYADETMCKCTIQGKTFLDWYGCCGDDTGNGGEDSPYEVSEISCTDNSDNDCDYAIDCQEYFVGPGCPPNPPTPCNSSTCSGSPTWDWSYGYGCADDLPACRIGSLVWCANCPHFCGDGICACGETFETCPGDCSCVKTKDVETWCDGLDNDCDNEIDEKCDDDLDEHCDDGSQDPVEIIVGSNPICDETDTTSQATIQATDDCQDWNAAIPGPDTDCDGEDDEDYISIDCGEGNCTNTTQCVLGTESCASDGNDCGVCCLCNATGNETYAPVPNDCNTIYCPGDACGVGGCQQYEWADYPDFISSVCIGLYTCQETVADCTPNCDALDADADDYSVNCSDCDDDRTNDLTQYTPAQILKIDIDADNNVAEHIHPGATSYCGNGVNENCEYDPPCTCSDMDGDGYNGTPYGPTCNWDCDDDKSDDPPNCPATPDLCNTTTTTCAICINLGIDETYNTTTGINYCTDAVDNDCDASTDFDDDGCKAVVEGYVTYWNTGTPLDNVTVRGYPPFVSDPSDLQGYYNLTTLAGKYFFGAYKEGYSAYPKEHTALGHLNITELNFTMFGCLEDCTRGGVCGDCQGAVGPTGGNCSYWTTHAMEVCLGSYPGSIAIYNLTDTIVCYIECCEGIPYCMNRIKVNVTGNVENIFKRTLIARWNKIPVKINILTFYNK